MANTEKIAVEPRLVKRQMKSPATAEMEAAEVAPAEGIAPPPHADRALWDEIIGLRWAELRAIYKRILGHPPTCKKCGHKL